MQVTLTSTEAELGSYPKAHICRLQWFAALWPTWGCILSAFGNLQPLWHSWTQTLTGGSVRGTWVWTKLPKWKNIFPLVFSRSQLTSLLLLSQSLRDPWRKSAGLSLPSGYRRIFCTTDLSTPRTCRVSLLLSQGQCQRQTVILWQRKGNGASQPPALRFTISGPRTSPCTASVLSCATSGLCRMCC